MAMTTERQYSAGFSLAENLVAAFVVSALMLGMVQVMLASTNQQNKVNDVPFAVNLAQTQVDQVQKTLTLQNSLVFPVPGSANMGKSYFLRTENITVSQYYFNNFPTDTTSDNHVDMSAVPWVSEGTGDYYVSTGISTDSYDPLVNAGTIYTLQQPGGGTYFQNSLFENNRFYTDGGEEIWADMSPLKTDYQAAIATASPGTVPKYVVRTELFGIPFVVQAEMPDISSFVRAADQVSGADYETGSVEIPPAKCTYLIGESCRNGTPAAGARPAGAVYLPSGTKSSGWQGPPTNLGAFGASPWSPESNRISDYYFSHYTSKLLVVRVYRIKDFFDDLTFNDPTKGKVDHDIASASMLIIGRVQLK